MPPQRRTHCSSSTRRTAGRTPAPRIRMTPFVTCDGVSDTPPFPSQRPPPADANAPPTAKALSASTPSASALFLRSLSPPILPSPHAPRKLSIAAPSCLAPPVSETRSASGPATPADSGCPRLSPRTPLPQAAQKKAPFPKRKEGPGSRPKLADARLTLRDRSLRGSRRWCTRSARRRVLPARR